MAKRIHPVKREQRLTGSKLTALARGWNGTRSLLSRLSRGKVPCGYIVAEKIERGSQGRIHAQEVYRWGRAA